MEVTEFAELGLNKARATAYAMCAVDALGMSAMLGLPVTSTEPGSERAITIQVNGNTARWDPGSAVAGHTRDSDATCCPSVDRTEFGDLLR